MFNAKFGWYSGPVVLKMLKFTDRHTKEKKDNQKSSFELKWATTKWEKLLWCKYWYR